MRLSDSAYRSLVVLNSAVLFLFVVCVLILGIMKRESIEQRVRNLIEREMANSAMDRSPGDAGSEEFLDIPTYDLKIKPASIREIETQLQQIIEVGMMTDDLKSWHSARFYQNGEKFDVKIRLRGDAARHWKGPKKSWRIKFEKDHMFQGRRYLDLIIPADKNYELEPVTYAAARELGLLVPDAGFCRIRINGVDFGLYFWMEKYSKEMLEKQGYPEGEIFRQANVWTQTRLNGFGISPTYYTSSFSSSIHEGPYLGYYAERWDTFVKLIRESDDSTFRREIPHLLDFDKYLAWNALTWLMGTAHSHWGDNLRWYYDNTSGLFQPILYDVNRSALRLASRNVSEDPRWAFESSEHDRLARRVMQIPEYRQRRNEILWRLLTEDRFDLARRCAEYFRQIRSGLLVGVGASPIDFIDRRHEETVTILAANRADLRGYMSFARMFVSPEMSLGDGPMPTLQLRLLPDSHSQIIVEEVRLMFDEALPAQIDLDTTRLVLVDIDGKRAMVQPAQISMVDEKTLSVGFTDLAVWTPVDPALEQVPGEWTLELQLPGIPPADWRRPGMVREVRVMSRNSVSKKKISGAFTKVSPIVYQFGDEGPFPLTRSVDDFIAASNLPFSKSNQQLTLPPGTHIVRHDLILPAGYGLKLGAATVLRLAPGVSIVVHGPLNVSGTRDRPTRIVPEHPGRPWGSVAVIGANEPSWVRHLEIEGGSEAYVNGVYLSGQLSFYWSEVHLEDSTVAGAQADDGLNIKKANFHIRRCQFRNNSADAFDGDWVRGTVESSVFVNNGGDGVDLSGSTITIRDSLLAGMGDKAISVGERSNVVVFNSVLRDSLIGVASKDLSSTGLYASVLYNNETAVAVYRKKQVFGGGTGKALGCLFWKNRKNVSLDALSRFEVSSSGADHWDDQDNMTAIDLIRGDPGPYFTDDGRGNIIHASPDSPFTIRAETAEIAIGDLTIPNLAGMPVGLLHPLDLEQELVPREPKAR